jgi:hypothetical protein
MGGLVASPKQWARLTRDWQKILQDVNLTDFHAADCANGGGAFLGWEKSDRDKLFIRFVDLTKRAVSYRVWTAVVMDDYHSIFNDAKEKFPYSLCALGCASRLRWLAMRRGADFAIPYVFDQGEKGKWAFAVFNRILAKRNGDMFRMGALSKGDRLKIPPLQAADLHAYEVYRYFADQLAQSDRAIRGSFNELLTIADGGGYILTGDKLEIITNGVIRQKLDGSEGPIKIPVDHLDQEHGIKLTPPSPLGFKNLAD